MNYKGEPLENLSARELRELCAKLFAELRMTGSTLPEDIKVNDIADLLPPEEPWNPPHISAVLYKGVGKPGGK